MIHLLAALALAVASQVAVAPPAVGAGCRLPVDGAVVRPFAPVAPYGGHWGVDLGVPEGTPVRSVAAGVVTYSGVVAGTASVTVDHGDGIRTSYSYLTERALVTGASVAAGAMIGRSGVDHGLAALHWSVRLGNRYLDPIGWACLTAPGDGLHLVPVADGGGVRRTG
jgi:murein DD-endopeptidase MepM/ murein hydrolase activator NlpD